LAFSDIAAMRLLLRSFLVFQIDGAVKMFIPKAKQR
jgi:hypothetical protein